MKKIFLCMLLGIFGMTASSKVPLQEAVVVALGDSNTWLGADDCSGEKGWSKWFKDMAKPKEMRSYSRSGATWCHSPLTRLDMTEDITWNSDNNVILTQIMRLDEDLRKGATKPDYVIIAAGINDIWSGKRPQVWGDENSPMSLAGSVKLACDILRCIVPDAQIIMSTPALNGATTDEDMHKVGETIAKAAPGAIIARIDLEPKPDTYDGVHTSVEGAKAVAAAVYKAITK